MTGSGCSRRKHTPIVSGQQRKLFGAVASGSTKIGGLSKTEAVRHLKESKGKKLVKKVDKKLKKVFKR